MRFSPHVPGVRASGARKRLRSLVCGALLIVTLCLATACGGVGGSASGSIQLPDGLKKPSVLSEAQQFWIPGVFLVAVVSNNDGFQNNSAAVSALTGKINDILDSSSSKSRYIALGNRDWKIEAFTGAADAPQKNDKPEDFLVFGNVAIASYRLMKNNSSTTDEEAADLTATVNAINSAADAHTSFSVGSATVWLAGATPDLLGEGSSLNHVGGSPGSGPTKPANSHQWKKPLTNNGNLGDKKTIYILDTLYGLDTLFGTTNDSLCLQIPGAPTPVSQTPTPTQSSGATTCDLLAVSEPKELTDFAVPSPESLWVEGYDYSDDWAGPDSFARHGLFIAAILHHLAPKATLSPIPVLNTKGATDVRSLIYGLYLVSTSGSSPANTLVNMSLTLQPPTTCLATLWPPPLKEGEKEVEVEPYTPNYIDVQVTTGEDANYILHDAALFAHCTDDGDIMATANARLYVPLALVIQRMISQGYTLVAAAGNESNGDSERFGADMPAAFCGVHAAAATQSAQDPASEMKSQNKLASFSNQPSLTGGTCIQPSADVVSTPLELGTASVAYATGSNVCSFFSGNKSPRDMGIWSGTSFAVPFETAHLATGDASSDQPC